MIEPERPTRAFIEGMISFHESGLQLYRQNEQMELAAWSKKELEKWRAKLEAREPGDGE